MVDGFTFRVVTEPFQASMRQLDRDTDRATMWALRAVGRKVKREGRKRAPVYRGSRKTVSVGGGKHIPLVPGLLRASISSSRRLQRVGPGAYMLRVGPRGGHVHLYAAKQEKRAPFMEPAYEVAVSNMVALHAAAWERAMRKAGRI